MYAWVRGVEVLYVGMSGIGLVRPLDGRHPMAVHVTPEDQLLVWTCGSESEAYLREQELIGRCRPTLNCTAGRQRFIPGSSGNRQAYREAVKTARQARRTADRLAARADRLGFDVKLDIRRPFLTDDEFVEDVCADIDRQERQRAERGRVATHEPRG